MAKTKPDGEKVVRVQLTFDPMLLEIVDEMAKNSRKTRSAIVGIACQHLIAYTITLNEKREKAKKKQNQKKEA